MLNNRYIIRVFGTFTSNVPDCYVRSEEIGEEIDANHSCNFALSEV